MISHAWTPSQCQYQDPLTPVCISCEFMVAGDQPGWPNELSVLLTFWEIARIDPTDLDPSRVKLMT